MASGAYTHRSMILKGSNPPPSRIDDLLDPKLVARLDKLDYRTRRLFAGKLQGERRSKKRGQSVEFDDYRDYVPGDDLRFIDWNVYARFDRLFIKLFLEEEDLAVHIAVDASRSMEAGEPSKLMYAARLAMALAYIGLVSNNRVGMSIIGAPRPVGSDGTVRSAIARLPDLRGRHHLPRLAGFIADSMWPEGRRSSGEGAPFSESVSNIARARVGKGVMALISDFLIDPAQGGYEPGLRALSAAGGGGYDTYCLQVLAPGEVEPEREAESGMTGDVRLVDAETGRAAEITLTAALIKNYKQRLEQYCAALHSFCLARRMAHILVRSDAPLEPLILETFRRAGMVG